MTNFPLKLSLRIDWSEMDVLGHVNNVAYFKYIQAARVNYWEFSKLGFLSTDIKVGPILLSTSCQFIKPLFYPGNILVESGIEFIKTTSFGIHHRILNDKNEIVAEAHDVVVTYDFSKNEKVPVPADVRSAIEDIEGRKL
jgi:acyl-CoA thioester hydrolase